MKSVCVFCGSKNGDSPVFAQAAFGVGKALGARGLDVVYGGAQHGLMGALADGALSVGGRVVGIIPNGLARQEFAHAGLTEAVFVDTMAERKNLMIERADAFITLPGGFGTLDELFEVLTGAQVGLHRKPIGVLNLEGFFDPLLAWIGNSLQRGFIPGGLKDVLVVEPEPEALVTTLMRHAPPEPAVRWISK